jgi:hypothetical protein
MRYIAVLLVAACGSADVPVVEGPPPDAAAPPPDAAPPGDAPPEPDAFVAPAVEVGSSLTEYAVLADGGDLAVFQGPQGGFHVYLTLRARGVAPGTRTEGGRLCAIAGTWSNPCVTFQVTDESGAVRLDVFNPLRLPLTPSTAAPGSYDLLPPRLITLNIRSFEEVDRMRVRVRAAVDDVAGAHAESSVVVTASASR